MTSPAYIHESALLTTSQWQRSAAQPRRQSVTQLCRLDGKVIAEASVSFASGGDQVGLMSVDNLL